MQEAKISHVAVIGTGTIGASWTALFLARGLTVAASDPAPQAEIALAHAIPHPFHLKQQSGPQANQVSDVRATRKIDVKGLWVKPSSIARSGRRKIYVQGGLGTMKVKSDLVDEVAAEQRSGAEAHGPDDRAKTIHRQLNRIERQRARDALDPRNGKAAHRG